MHCTVKSLTSQTAEQGHLEDPEAVGAQWVAHVDAAVKAARPQERIVQQRSAVCRADDEHLPACDINSAEAVESECCC